MVDHIQEQLNKPHSLLHDSAVNHGLPRRHRAKLTCNMPILAWRWDINKLLKRRKIRIHFLQRKCLNFFLTFSLARCVWQVHVISFSSRHRDLQLCYQGWRWKVISSWSLVRGVQIFNPKIWCNVDPELAPKENWRVQIMDYDSVTALYRNIYLIFNTNIFTTNYLNKLNISSNF